MAKKRRPPWDPFTRPQPTWDCVTHPTVLIQAWKKAHSYLRSKSWFADVLELDLSAVDLKNYINSLSTEIKAGPEAFAPAAMRLVPAPKSDENPWVFTSSGWEPGEETSKFMRPLAHLLLRDQVFATAILICLADYVETVQGDCSLSTEAAQKAGVSSYGNRLLCDWIKETGSPMRAEFTWGNAALYRKYYVDYRAFLQRPIDVCRRYRTVEGSDTEMGVVSLDLQGFYDAIPLAQARTALKSLCDTADVQSDEKFWQAVENCFAWNWERTDQNYKSLLKAQSLPVGIPQGLVAAGFFSNAYMVDFDRLVSRLIRRRKPEVNGGWKIVDYCRYVDDIRLVVVGTRISDNKNIAGNCAAWLGKRLKKSVESQKCNDKKSGYATHDELESRTLRPTLMSAIQGKLSGPFDLETLEDAGFALDGLLNTVRENEASYSSVSENATAHDDSPLSLARIHFAKHSVRDDTVVRFAAYRKVTSLRARRFLVAAEAGETRSLALSRVDAEMEMSARRLIRLWSRDPSLVIVLRHALNLFPAPELLEPVVEALKISVKPRSSAKENPDAAFTRAVALYAVGELFKAGLIETGVDVNQAELPEKADLDGYRELLADFASALLAEASTPWYVARPAVMFLLSVGRTPQLNSKARNVLGDEYSLLLSFVNEPISNDQGDPTHRVPLILVLDQLRGDRKRTLTRLRTVYAKLIATDREVFAEQLSLANPQLAAEFARQLRNRKLPASALMTEFVEASSEEGSSKHSTADLSRKSTLTQIMRARDNPFIQETAALQLLHQLAEAVVRNQFEADDLFPDGIALESTSNWTALLNPKRKLSLKVEKRSLQSKDPRYTTPSWAKGERALLYALGRVTRAAVLGNSDFTATGYEFFQCRDGYCGLRSSWFKRQHGLSAGLSISEWESASCSPWFASLITHLLSWPGSRVDPDGEFVSIVTVRGLLRAVKQRLGTLKSIFGSKTSTPFYDVPVSHAFTTPPILSMALIQTVRPTHGDLVTHGAELSSRAIRPVHRGHLASTLRLAADHISLRKTYDKPDRVDLVVLPELAVHRDDLDLVKRFIDATQAIVFCGIAFHHNHRRGGLVNSGLWIIPEHRKTGRSFRLLTQGKKHLIPSELTMNVLPYRPHQFILKLHDGVERKPYAVSATICFDATDLALAADLRDQTDMMIVAANNKDVPTFDTMATALSWHMFQHIVIVNSGEFGGSVVCAPYKQSYERVLKHDHGGFQAAISIVEIDLSDYQRMRERPPKKLKSPPAGFTRH